MAEKATIANIIMDQAVDSLHLAIQARERKSIHEEVKQVINVFLLLGVTLEGVINEVGESYIDTWTWNELEKTTTPLKWRIVSAIKKGYSPSEMILQTVQEVHKKRNAIAHLKPHNHDDEVILISEEGIIKTNPEPDYRLPEGDLRIYIGYEKKLQHFNARDALMYTKRALEAIIDIAKLFEIEKNYEWCNAQYNRIKDVKVNKNELGF